VHAYVNDGSAGALRAPVPRLFGEPPLSPPSTLAAEAQLAPAIPPLRVPQPQVAAPPQLPAPARVPAETTLVARVFVRLGNGDRVEVASLPDLAAARLRAEDVVRELMAPREGWPFFAGRYVRPDAVVSVDLEAAPG